MKALLRYLRPVSDKRYWLGLLAVVIGIIHTSWGIGGAPVNIEPVPASAGSFAALAAGWAVKLPTVMTVTGLFMMPIGVLFMAMPHIEHHFGIKQDAPNGDGGDE